MKERGSIKETKKPNIRSSNYAIDQEYFNTDE